MADDPKRMLAMVDGLIAMKTMDPEDILATLTVMRTMIPPEYRRAPQEIPETTSRLDGSTEEDLLWDAAEEAVRSFLAEVEAVRDAKEKKLFEMVLDMYYAAEEASHDPANAHLLPELEKIRAAYVRDYGHPIPTREETEARRRGEG